MELYVNQTSKGSVYESTMRLRSRLISAILAVLLLLCAYAPVTLALAASSSSSQTEGYIDADSLNMRAKPSKKSKIIKEYEGGQTVQIIGEDGDWYKVKVEGKTGYMLKKYVKTGEAPVRTAKPTRTEKPKRTAKPEKTQKPKKTEEPTRSTRQSSDMVWIPTKGGKKYHSNSSCSNMDNPEEVTLDEAKAKGFTACKKCY